MTGWVLFWTVVLVISVLIFAGVAVGVTVGGAREIRGLLRSASASRRAPEE